MSWLLLDGMLPKNESTPLQFLPISTLSAVCQGSQSCSSVMHSMKGCPLRPRCSCSTIPTPHQPVHTNARPQHNGPFPMSRSASQQAKPLLCFSERYGRNSRRHGETSGNDPPILAIWRTSLQYGIPVEVQHYLQIHRNCRLVMVKGATNLQPGGNFRMISLERQIRFNSLRC